MLIIPRRDQTEMEQGIAYHLANAISLSVLMSSSASLAVCLQYTAQISRKEASDAESAPGKREKRERGRGGETERVYVSCLQCTFHISGAGGTIYEQTCGETAERGDTQPAPRIAFSRFDR